MQDSSTLLLTHAQLSVAIAGFAGIAATLRRPLTPLLNQRFLALMSLSFLQVMAGLFPVWLTEFIPSYPSPWRTAIGLMLVLYSVHLIALVLLPMKSVGRTISVVINPPVTFLTWAITIISLCSLGVTVGSPESPSLFTTYYGANAIFLFTQFVLFADLATASDARHGPDA